MGCLQAGEERVEFLSTHAIGAQIHARVTSLLLDQLWRIEMLALEEDLCALHLGHILLVVVNSPLI